MNQRLEKQGGLILIVLLLTLIGLLCSLYSTHHFVGVNYQLLDEPAACNLNDTFSCDDVNLSPYARFLRIPIAVWGVWFYSTLFVFSLLTLIGSLISPTVFWGDRSLQ